MIIRGSNGRKLALAGFALIAVAAVTLALLGPSRALKYTGSFANPSLGNGFALTPAADRPPAPAMAFIDATGKAMTLDAFRGHAVLVNLWATWCPPCVAEMPTLDTLQSKLGGDTFQVAPISLDRGGVKIGQAWLQRSGLTHLTTFAANAANFPDAMLPTSMLIDAQGRLAWKGIGGRAWDAPATIAMVEALIAGKTP